MADIKIFLACDGTETSVKEAIQDFKNKYSSFCKLIKQSDGFVSRSGELYQEFLYSMHNFLCIDSVMERLSNETFTHHKLKSLQCEIYRNGELVFEKCFSRVC